MFTFCLPVCIIGHDSYCLNALVERIVPNYFGEDSNKTVEGAQFKQFLC